jgi:hypothetical protein
MEPLVLEGTWEEIRAHDAELAGRRVRLMIIADELKGEDTAVPPPPREPPEHGTLAETLAGRIGRLNFGPPNLSEKVEEAFGEILEAKYREQVSRE